VQISLIQTLLIIFILIATVWVFINTIITKKWRNKAPGEAESWKAGIFYYNPDDKRLMLPKRTGLGFTLNFAQPTAIILFLLLVFIIIIVACLNRGCNI